MATGTQSAEPLVHQCPACGVECAVAADEMHAAQRAGKDIRISCHKCSDVFAPAAMPQDKPLDVARCPSCSGQFSVPPLPAGQVVELQCPLCQADIKSDALSYDSIGGKKRHGKAGRKNKSTGSTRQRLKGLFGGKKTKPAKAAKKAAMRPAAANMNASNSDAPSSVTDTAQQTANDEIARLFEDRAKKQKSAADAAAEDKKTRKRARKSTSKSLRVLVLILFAVLGAAGAGYVVTSTTDGPVKLTEIFTAQQVTPTTFSIINAQYERVETAVGNSVVITVTLENSGDREGTPGAIRIELLDSARQPIMNWPVQSGALNMRAGETRAFVTRIFEPPSEFNDIQVTLTPN